MRRLSQCDLLWIRPWPVTQHFDHVELRASLALQTGLEARPALAEIGSICSDFAWSVEYIDAGRVATHMER